MKPLLQELSKAATGLYVISETDAPLEPVSFPNPNHKKLTKEKVVQLSGKPAGYKIEEQDLDYFFRNHTVVRPEYGEEEKVTAARFQKVVTLLKQQLKNAKAWRLGEVNIEVLIIGEDSDKDFSGFRTQLVET
ncbi:MAG: nuclease A inhibitor family protein [Hymenobacteraceae bacterium]|nr:nuclease A inhibitor family protein [Hymenobacteraceae bacterium]MDX5395673.1 nuclease A inhibitor family protein [Hymenobacteraceae bacterium]MDX5511726.1 nuclease A inhibitor family protein [Hymenobacteraceae bacterium]